MAIGFWRSWALVTGMMIGSGIYTLPAVLAPYGSYSFVAWVFTVAGALCLVSCLRHLAARNPEAGGPSAYVLEAFGRVPAIIVAWGYWVGMLVAVAAIALSFAGYLAVFFPVIKSSQTAATSVALGIVWIFTYVSLRGTEVASTVQLITTILKIIPLLAIGVLGLSFGDITAVPAINPNNESFVVMMAGMMLLIMWSYLGIEVATIPADDTENPQTTIPRASLYGMLTATAVYVLALAGVMAMLPLGELSQSAHPFSDVAGMIFGPVGAVIVGVGALISIGGTLNGCVFLTGKLPFAGAQAGLFPKFFGRSRNQGSATSAVLFSSCLASILILANASKGLIKSFEFMIVVSTFLTLIVFLGAALASTKLQLVDRGNGIQIRPVTFIISLLGIVFSFAAIYGAWTLYR